MTKTIAEYKDQYTKLLGEKQLLRKQLKEKNTQLRNEKQNYEYLLEAQSIVIETVKETQNQIKLRITDIVNTALDSIEFPKKPDSFDIEFVEKRNQLECELFVVENGVKMNSVKSCGGGINVVLSFALRLSCLALKKHPKSNIIILDEPFKDINDPNDEYNLKQQIAEMLKYMSDKLKLQLIIVGSNNDFKEIGNKVFKVCIDENNNSKVEEI